MPPGSGKALLFDIDGTLADTDALHVEAFNHVFGPRGHVIARFQQQLVGRGRARLQGFKAQLLGGVLAVVAFVKFIERGGEPNVVRLAHHRVHLEQRKKQVIHERAEMRDQPLAGFGEVRNRGRVGDDLLPGAAIVAVALEP